MIDALALIAKRNGEINTKAFMKSSTPSRTIEGYADQLPKIEPISDFNHNDFVITNYVGKSWRHSCVPEWSHFDHVQKWGSSYDLATGEELIQALG
ncbi:MAG: hypothetical protein ACKO96_38375, partial [Flammeovirgaceae bacterium]